MPDGNNCCSSCGDSLSVETLAAGGRTARRDVYGELFCEACFNEHYMNCGSCGSEIDRNNERCYQDGHQTACESCFTDFLYQCGSCHRIGPNNEGMHVSNPRSTTDRILCRSCYNRRYVNCNNCGDSVDRNTARRTMVGTTPRFLCQGCQGREQWPYRDFPACREFDEIRSHRKFGIELETSSCPEHHTLRELTILGCKEDGSVDGMEFISPPMYGDGGLQVIRDFCDHARRMEFKVDSACGYHVHCDLTNENSEQLSAIALAYHYTYPVWMKFVSRSRRTNYYCVEHDYNPSDFKMANNFAEFMDQFITSDRYKWINWHAYRQHKTLEIRFHGGTLNEAKIINWIKAHLRFIDHMATLRPATIARKFAGRSTHDIFYEMAETWNDEALTNYFMERAAEFGSRISRDELVLA